MRDNPSMPIRVLLADTNIIAPLPESEWESLRQRVRSKEITLRLPCCGGAAFPRLSARGLQHFAHYRNEGCEPETEEHIAAKLEIVQACRALNLNAVPEYVGDGWRADVFVQVRAWNACFEIQLSPQSFQETIQRQKAYKEKGVRCCWLFARLPPRQAALEEQTPFSSLYATPMFQLCWTSSLPKNKIHFSVEVNGSRRPLRRFIQDLLLKRLRYCRSLVVPPVSATVSIWRVACNHCWRRFHFFYVSELHGRTQCGAQLEVVHHRLSKLYPREYEPFFTHVTPLLAGRLFSFHTREHNSECRAFVCPACGEMAITEKPPSKARGLRHEFDRNLEMRLQAGQAVSLSHWCDASNCVVDSTPFEIQGVLSMPEVAWIDSRRFHWRE